MEEPQVARPGVQGPGARLEWSHPSRREGGAGRDWRPPFPPSGSPGGSVPAGRAAGSMGRARGRRGRSGPAPTQCANSQCFDPLVRGCVACRLFRTPEPGPGRSDPATAALLAGGLGARRGGGGSGDPEPRHRTPRPRAEGGRRAGGRGPGPGWGPAARVALTVPLPLSAPPSPPRPPALPVQPRLPPTPASSLPAPPRSPSPSPPPRPPL